MSKIKNRAAEPKNKQEPNSLPETSQLKNGGEFYPNDDVWVLKSGVESSKVDFSALENRLSAHALHGYKKTLEWFARNKSLETVTVANRAFLAMISNASDAKVTLVTD